jgi:hypothetical protein
MYWNNKAASALAKQVLSCNWKALMFGFIGGFAFVGIVRHPAKVIIKSTSGIIASLFDKFVTFQPLSVGLELLPY